MILHANNWVAVTLSLLEDYSGKVAVAYNAAGLTVTYRINGGSNATKTLTANDWKEGTLGAYMMRFTSNECSLVGTLSYEVSFTDCVVAYGSEQITRRQPSLISLGRM